MFALVVFLMAAMISTVIINAALTNAAGVTSRQKYEQAYQTVSSMALLIEDEILAVPHSGGSLTKRYMALTELSNSGTGVTTKTVDYDQTANAWSEPVADAIRYIFQQKTDTAGTTPYKELKINANVTDGSDKEGVVALRDSLNNKMRIVFSTTKNTADPYELKVTISMKDPSYTMTMVFSSQIVDGGSKTDKETVGENEITTTTKKTYFYYDNVTVQK